MRLGLLADIHEAVLALRQALNLFREQRVDEVVVLGDICQRHLHLEETVALLHEAGASGVWGNHDFGLCQHPSPEVRQRFAPAILDYMASLRPTLRRDDCLFSHVEPWLDATDLAQLWYFEGPPETPDQRAQIFTAVPERVLFTGHVHRWFLATPEGKVAWDGSTPIRLACPTRYFVILHAVCAGHCAIYDTTTGDLIPFRVTPDEVELS